MLTTYKQSKHSLNSIISYFHPNLVGLTLNKIPSFLLYDLSQMPLINTNYILHKSQPNHTRI